jgi:hypothetical protein
LETSHGRVVSPRPGAPSEPPIRSWISARFHETADVSTVPDSTHNTGNYAIENLIGIDKPFQVRLLLKDDPRMGGTLIDAEIAGQRTMITFRPGLRVRKLIFRTEGVELDNVGIASLK